MSWIERLNNKLIITCGDGREFTPKWKNAVKTLEYNVTEFNFPEVSGTLVKRQRPKGRKYGIEFYFEGEDNIEVSNDFEASSNDPRPWVISHPYYDRIVVQPLSLNIDNTKHNSTKITGTIIETITDTNPRTSVDAQDKIIADQGALNTTFEESYVNDVSPVIDDVNQMNENNDALFLEGEKAITDTSDFESYFNAFNTANSAILNAIDEPLTAIRTLQAVINAPALFLVGIELRVETLKTQFEKLLQSIVGITEFSLKKLFENNAGVLVSAMALALVSNSTFSSRTDVFSFIEGLIDDYANYLTNLDNIQSDNSNSPDSFVPDFRSQLLLNDLINFTVSNLFEIAIDSRQERSIILEEDNNIINVAHRFYGLEINDSTIDELISTNEIGLNEYLGLKKGRKIVYFV
jgi:hypothetical protein